MNFSHDSVLRIRLCRTLARNSLQKELRFFFKLFSIVLLTTAPYHQRSNVRAERFVDTSSKHRKGQMETIPLTRYYKIHLSISADTEPTYKFGVVTGRIIVHEENKITFRQAVTKGKYKRRNVTIKKSYTPGEKICFQRI